MSLPHSERFRAACAPYAAHFDAVAFDAWLDTLPASRTRASMLERRTGVMISAALGDEPTLLRNLEFMNTQWQLQAADAARTAGLKRGKAMYTQWIERQLRRDPDATAAELWARLAAKALKGHTIKGPAGRRGSHIVDPDGKETLYKSFRNAVSECRSASKIPK